MTGELRCHHLLDDAYRTIVTAHGMRSSYNPSHDKSRAVAAGDLVPADVVGGDARGLGCGYHLRSAGEWHRSRPRSAIHEAVRRARKRPRDRASLKVRYRDIHVRRRAACSSQARDPGIFI
jgi:hypothetical protein